MVEDFTPYFADFGTAGTLSGVSVRGIFDSASEVVEGDAITQRPTYLIQPSDGVSPTQGQVLALGGASYQVRQVLAEPPDGVLSRLVLVRL